MTTDPKSLVEQIERRVGYILGRLHLASRLLLRAPDDNTPITTEPITTLTWWEIESYAPQWAFLVSDDAVIKAGIIHELAARYRIVPEAMPQTAEILGFDDPSVASAYQDTYERTLADLFAAERAEPPVDHSLQAELIEGLDWRVLRRGDVLIRQGEPGDGLYVLLDGLLDIETDVDGDDIADIEIAQVHSGEFVGEVSLLTGEPHDATVTARRDSDLAFLSVPVFEALIADHPDLLRRIARQSVERLRAVYSPRPRREETLILAVIAATDGVAPFVMRLATNFSATSPDAKPLVLTPEVAREMIGMPIEDMVDDYEFVDWLNRQRQEHAVIICAGDAAYPNWTRRIVELANRVLVAGRADESPELGAQEHLLAALPAPEAAPPTELVLLHDRRDVIPSNTRAWLALRKVVRHHHIAVEHNPDYARLIRHLRGRSIGVVFGGGGMRGAAHAGILQALDEYDIPVDYVGGTSAGAIVAAQAGMEWSVPRIMQETKDRLLKRNVLFEYTFPYAAMTTARLLSGSYVAMFGDALLEDLWIPTFTIASNLTQARMEVMETGSVVLAVRASTSLAGIHPPAIADNNDLLLDGGGFNNTPADVMRARIGTGTVIAVDMGFTKRDFPEYDYGYYFNGFRWLLNRLNLFRRKEIIAPFVANTLMRSNGLWSMQKTSEQVAHADLILRPPVSEFGLFDLDSGDAIYEAGYTYAKEALATWPGATTG